MIIGDPSIFALESGINEAYERLSIRALGFFVIHIGGRCYGKKGPETTILSAAFDQVGRRIHRRGSHCSSVLNGADAEAVASAYIGANYIDHDESELFFGMSDSQFIESVNSAGVLWAPDGEEGFDDGSHILQFDVGDNVRLIAFTRRIDPVFDPGSLHEVWLPQYDFYETLQYWYANFENEWKSLPKHGYSGQ